MQFILVIPEEWKAVSNTPVENQSEPSNLFKELIKRIVPSSSETKFTQIKFAQTDILPTYLFGFVIGDLHIETYQGKLDNHRNLKDLNIVVPKSQKSMLPAMQTTFLTQRLWVSISIAHISKVMH